MQHLPPRYHGNRIYVNDVTGAYLVVISNLVVIKISLYELRSTIRDHGTDVCRNVAVSHLYPLPIATRQAPPTFILYIGS